MGHEGDAHDAVDAFASRFTSLDSGMRLADRSGGGGSLRPQGWPPLLRRGDDGLRRPRAFVRSDPHPQDLGGGLCRSLCLDRGEAIEVREVEDGGKEGDGGGRRRVSFVTRGELARRSDRGRVGVDSLFFFSDFYESFLFLKILREDKEAKNNTITQETAAAFLFVQ